MEKKDVVISIICLVLLGVGFLIGVGLGINLFFEQVSEPVKII